MGVPKFFRWISERYPAILSGVIDSSFETPTIDNLYLDMNGIVHNCSHDNEELTLSVSNDVIITKVLREIDRLVIISKPTSVLFIAVDGVAPRAKLNQQRSRRFRSSRDRRISIEKGKLAGLIHTDSDVFDSNCITPGTVFMRQLSIGIRAFIESKLKEEDTVWSNLKVFFSGSEVPGEGEHKIMAFIRSCRAQPDCSPNIRHCINGADADMIMLSLTTHEPYFLVLRDVLESRNTASRSNKFKSMNSSSSNSAQVDVPVDGEEVTKPPKSMQFVRIHVLREYLIAELLESLVVERFNKERVIDDFVFLTFFVGNDFLPHLPALDIGDSAFDVIFEAYKTVLAAAAESNDQQHIVNDLNDEGVIDTGCGLYLVDGDRIDHDKLELIFALIGVTELTMYTDNEMEREWKEERIKAQRLERQQQDINRAHTLKEKLTAETNVIASVNDEISSTMVNCSSRASPIPSTCSTSSLASQCSGSDPIVSTRLNDAIDNMNGKAEGLNPIDREIQYKCRYYKTKFNIDLNNSSAAGSDVREYNPALREIVRQYMLGLQWCLSYYSRGCVSWSWFYPYHYGPFLHDMVGLKALAGGELVYDPAVSNDEMNCGTKILSTMPPPGLQLSAPFTPFQQLLACLPSTSCSLLPRPYHWLMCEPDSPLYAYYPLTFTTDLNGKRQEYESVVLLPFIDKDVLLRAEEQYVLNGGQLTAEDVSRNTFGVTYEYQASVTEDMESVVDVTHHVVDIHPGECFVAHLIPGTITTEEGGLVGYPPFRKLEVHESYSSTKSKGKGSSRPRNNYYGKSQESSTGNACAVSNGSSSKSSPTTVSAPLVSLPAIVTVRLLLDDATAKFLYDLSAQIEVLSSDFVSLLNACTTSGDKSRMPFAVTVMTNVRTKPETEVVLSTLPVTASVTSASTRLSSVGIADVVDVDNLDTNVSTVVNTTVVEATSPPFDSDVVLSSLQNILQKTASIFTPVSCALLPNCRIDLVVPDLTLPQCNNSCSSSLPPSSSCSSSNDYSYYSVSIKFKNVSHYDQLEEYVKHRLISDIFGEHRVFYRNRMYSVVIGTYTGSNVNAFHMWLNNELTKLKMPEFTCSLMELDYVSLDGCNAEKSREVERERIFQYILNSSGHGKQ